MDFALIKQEIEQGQATLAHRVESMIAFIESLDEPATLKECQAQADAIAKYLAAQENVEDYYAALKVTARIKHRLGEVLAATVNHAGAKGVGVKVTPTIPPCLGETPDQRKNTSKRSQAIAAIPWERIEQAIDEQQEKAVEATGKGRPAEKAKLGSIVKHLGKKIAAERIAAEPPPLPTGPFRVIVADPPWKYDNRADDRKHRAANPYPSMTLEEIKALPVGGVAHEDCVLWLWTTNAHIWHVPEILAAWGFEYKTLLTWAKDRMGTGDWLRGQTEHCVMAVRGRPATTLTNQTTLIKGPLREHSRKPEEFYALVESLCPAPEMGRCELFQRTPRPGWTGHGNDTSRFSRDA